MAEHDEPTPKHLLPMLPPQTEKERERALHENGRRYYRAWPIWEIICLTAMGIILLVGLIYVFGDLPG